MKLALLAGVTALMVVLGVGLYVTEFTAYLGDNPTTCNNCHVMDAVYESWYHGGHRQWAKCSDCHTPHPFFRKYLVKALSGMRHVSVFTLGHIPAAIRPLGSSLRVVQENCLYCHAETVDNVNEGKPDSGRYCFDCHRSVSHGERGISLLSYQHREDNR